jgi:CheY-like chemotaxis protein
MDRAILVVEDDEQIREIIAEALGVAGYLALTAGNGAEALEVLERAPARPRVIVLDWMMPVMGGQEVVAALTMDPRFTTIPLLVLSACDRPLKIPGLPVAVVLSKPVRMRTLLEIVDRLAGHPMRQTAPFVTGRFPAIRPSPTETGAAKKTIVLRKPTSGGEGPG